ncbi:MAG: hypothetical protein HRU19_31655 [Pseudobacteriovorax sp.]|nr:hypothetical protein [Pseudobacteriovorax sp.]
MKKNTILLSTILFAAVTSTVSKAESNPQVLGVSDQEQVLDRVYCEELLTSLLEENPNFQTGQLGSGEAASSDLNLDDETVEDTLAACEELGLFDDIIDVLDFPIMTASDQDDGGTELL